MPKPKQSVFCSSAKKTKISSQTSLLDFYQRPPLKLKNESQFKSVTSKSLSYKSDNCVINISSDEETDTCESTDKNTQSDPNNGILLGSTDITDSNIIQNMHHSDNHEKSNNYKIEKETVVSTEQYYHKHFMHAIDTVMNEPQNKILFNDFDMDVLKSFKNISVKEQNLYIRLFGRKHQWLRENTIKYPEISQNILGILSSVVDFGLLENEASLLDLESALKLLYMPELKMVSKYFKIGSEVKGKKHIIDAFLQHGQRKKQVNCFFNTVSIENKVLEKCKETIGKCFRLHPESRKVFIRLLLLFDLTGLVDQEDSASGGQQKTLLNLLMVDKGHLKFPNYNIIKEKPVFPDRNSLINYELSKQLELNILNAYNEKGFQQAYELYLVAKQCYEDKCNMQRIEIEKPESKRQVFLQQFTSNHVYICCLNHGVDILQKLKMYQDAVDLLWMLLKEQEYCQKYRGHWWDRLTLILDYHQKNPKLTLDAVGQALNDQTLYPAHKFVLSKRGIKILEQMEKQESKKTENKKRKLKAKQLNYIDIRAAVQANLDFEEAPKVTIIGRQLPGQQTGYKSVFVLPSSSNSEQEGEVTLLSVEELALDHYRNEGYSEGIHGETSTIISLFCLLFWDAIYGGSIPNVFQNPYQAWPLDLGTSDFYENRISIIDERLLFIKLSSKEELQTTVNCSWEKYVGTTSLVNWDLFTGPKQVEDLVKLLTNESLYEICKLLAKDFRHYRSGFPDLIVWNPFTGELKVVEVKGPQDRLSPKQIIWLHILLKLNVPAEVCHINAVGTKRLKS